MKKPGRVIKRAGLWRYCHLQGNTAIFKQNLGYDPEYPSFRPQYLSQIETQYARENTPSIIRKGWGGTETWSLIYANTNNRIKEKQQQQRRRHTLNVAQQTKKETNKHTTWAMHLQVLSSETVRRVSPSLVMARPRTGPE